MWLIIDDCIFSPKVWFCYHRYVCELWVAHGSNSQKVAKGVATSLEFPLKSPWSSRRSLVSLLDNDIGCCFKQTSLMELKSDSIQVRIWFQHQQRPLYRAACFAKIGMLVISTCHIIWWAFFYICFDVYEHIHTQYNQRHEGKYIIYYILNIICIIYVVTYYHYVIYIYIYMYVNFHIHISQLQFGDVKLSDSIWLGIFCRSLQGQNNHSGQITYYPRI